MKKIIYLVVLTTLLYFAIPPYRDSWSAPLPPPPRTLAEIISSNAEKYGVSEKLLTAIISCESSGNPTAHNLNSKEDSWGLVQINLKAWNITKEQAINEEFAVDFLAEKLSKNQGYYWTCYNTVHAKGLYN